jgi:hypothetical protein
MKKSLVSFSLLVTLAACPAPSIDSIDGLAGGALTSKVTAPAVAATEMSTETLDATGEVTAAAVTAGAVTSSGPVAGSSVIVQRGAARVSVFGLIVGSTPQIVGETGPDAASTTPNYAVRQQACSAAFPATDALPPGHVCTAQEAMAHALQAPDTVPTTASGGVVHSYGQFSDLGAMVVPEGGNPLGALRLHRRDSDGFWSLRIENGGPQDTPLVCCQ